MADKHRVDTFIDDAFTGTDHAYGWQCFTCAVEAVGFEDMTAADAAADEHRNSGDPDGD